MTGKTQELNSSDLGTLEYWEKTYDLEIQNFKDYGDVGEVWFGNESTSKVVRCITSKLQLDKKSDRIIDLGCGNGIFLAELANEGFENLVGVDYSQKAIDLSSAVLKKNSISNVKLQMYDILNIQNEVSNEFKLAHDKGTYDAISLNPEKPREKRVKYLENVHKLLLPKGYLILTSCNWTKNELIEHFQESKHIPNSTFYYNCPREHLPLVDKQGTLLLSLFLRKSDEDYREYYQTVS